MRGELSGSSTGGSPDWRDAATIRLLESRLEIPNEELWAARLAVRHDLFEFARAGAGWRRTAARGLGRRHAPPRAPTIGFARRFTSYKRPTLLFRDPDRLARLITSADRPVQFVFAGKAHPADEAGKHHLQMIIRHALDPKMGGRIAFIDDYDLHVGRRLVQGCDVWLNTPRKPMEASGTSGMKAGMNGVLHLSIGDGQAEAHDGTNGWQIVGNPSSSDTDELMPPTPRRHAARTRSGPHFYDRDATGLGVAGWPWSSSRSGPSPEVLGPHAQGLRASCLRAGHHQSGRPGVDNRGWLASPLNLPLRALRHRDA
jgi:starch phosphorylase